jgi:hypothetical protein
MGLRSLAEGAASRLPTPWAASSTSSSQASAFQADDDLVRGHRDFRTTLIYADYAPGAREVETDNGGVRVYQSVYQLSTTSLSSDQLNPTKPLEIS